LDRITIVLGKGAVSPAIEFLLAGGTLHDFVSLITNTGDLRLRVGKGSLFAATN